MTWLKTAMTALLVAFWLPVSSHALLQSAGLIHLLHADHDADSTDSHEHHADDHDAADGLCVSSSTHVDVPVPASAVSPQLMAILAAGWAGQFRDEPHPSGLAPPGTAPPPLSHCWQFSFRTALPPRAPCFIS